MVNHKPKGANYLYYTHEPVIPEDLQGSMWLSYETKLSVM